MRENNGGLAGTDAGDPQRAMYATAPPVFDGSTDEYDRHAATEPDYGANGAVTFAEPEGLEGPPPGIVHQNTQWEPDGPRPDSRTDSLLSSYSMFTPPVFDGQRSDYVEHVRVGLAWTA